jgi:hypothetical protein
MRAKYLPNNLENFYNTSSDISTYVTLPSIKFRNIYEIIKTIHTSCRKHGSCVMVSDLLKD